MSETDDRRPVDEEKFKLSVEVPEHVRHDRVQLRQWLEAMSVDLLNADQIQVTEDVTEDLTEDLSEGTLAREAGGGGWVSVTMSVRLCGGRLPADQGEDDDGDPGDFGGGVGDDVGDVQT